MARRGDDDHAWSGPAEPGPAAPDDGAAHDAEERHRHAARAYFRAAPPYRIQPEPDGRFTLRVKRYRYREAGDPALSTEWPALSFHAEFEEAERRLRRVAAPGVFYDARGRQVPAPREPERDWGVPEDDEGA